MAKKKPFDENSDLYENWFKKNPEVYQSELCAIKDLLPENQSGFEIGIGSGLFAQPLGIKEGIDPSAKMASLARKRGLKVFDEIAEKLPYEDLSKDFALMVTSICFIDDLSKALQEAYRVLKFQGSLIIGFVDKESPVGKIYQQFKDESVFYKEAVFYSTKEVLTHLEKENFKIEKINQTVFGQIEEIDKVQDFKEGYGEGSFVVIKALKEETSKG